MHALRMSALAKISWVGVCVAILLITQPWQGGDGNLSFFFWLIIVSFPFGAAGAALFGLVGELAHGTAFEQQMCCTAFWWSSYLGLQLAVGYVQWFIAVPMLWAAIKRVLTLRSKTDAPPAGGTPLS